MLDCKVSSSHKQSFKSFLISASPNQNGRSYDKPKTRGEVPPEGEQKVAQEVEVDTTTSDDGENPVDPISEESLVRKTNDAPAEVWNFSNLKATLKLLRF